MAGSTAVPPCPSLVGVGRAAYWTLAHADSGLALCGSSCAARRGATPPRGKSRSGLARGAIARRASDGHPSQHQHDRDDEREGEWLAQPERRGNHADNRGGEESERRRDSREMAAGGCGRPVRDRGAHDAQVEEQCDERRGSSPPGAGGVVESAIGTRSAVASSVSHGMSAKGVETQRWARMWRMLMAQSSAPARMARLPRTTSRSLQSSASGLKSVTSPARPTSTPDQSPDAVSGSRRKSAAPGVTQSGVV